MPRLDLPDEPTNEIKLADWLEIYALISADEDSSKGDLEQALRTASVLEAQGDDAIERKCLEVFRELEHRARAADNAYPFELDGAILSVKSQRENYVGYIFCLCLSYFRWHIKKGQKVSTNPRLLFEKLSCVAAKEFVHGEVMSFGTARGKNAKSKRVFQQLVDEMCSRLGEGKGFREQSTLNRKDDKVDLVAWRDFKDNSPSKFVVFGQCASGEDWVEKVTELQPKEFCDQWMLEPPVSPLLRSFYIPHRIPSREWVFYSRKTGIIFDRCRVAYWAFQNNKEVVDDPRFNDWCQTVLPL